MNSGNTVRTGDALVKAGAITAAQLDMCLEAQDRLDELGQSVQLGELILSFGFASRSAVEAAVNQSKGSNEKALVPVELSGATMKRLGVIPLGVRNHVLYVSALGFLDDMATRELRDEVALSGHDVTEVINEPRDRVEVLRIINSGLSVDRAQLLKMFNDFSRDLQNGSLLNQIIEFCLVDALQSRASDIHVTLSNDTRFCWINFRIDSTLHPVFLVAQEAQKILVSRIKARAGMDFSDTRTPQDGRMTLTFNHRTIDVRVGSMPTDAGETLSIRLLDPERILPLSLLLAGQPHVAERLMALSRSAIKTGGLLLVTGPTGSGKSSTLTSFMRSIDRDKYRVMTAEDPVEIRVPLVSHTQINEAAGLTFAKVLRAFMRQDLDVAMVGEMRDQDTAEIAIRIAETGHMLLATLHTDNVPDSISRLIGMLSDSYRHIGTMAIASLLKGILNQRLLQRLCVCAKPEAFDPASAPRLTRGRQNLPATLLRRRGCTRCRGTGLYGRTPMIEAAFWPADESVRQEMGRLLLAGAQVSELLKLNGVFYQSREDSLWQLLAGGQIDLEMAALVIGEASA